MEILVLHPGALGDIILSLPAIALLRSRCRPARLTVAGNIDHLAPVLGGYADELLSLSTLPLHRLYGPGELPEEDRGFWRQFDRIVSWTGAGDAAFVRQLQGLHPAASVGAWRPGPDETRHVSQLFADSLGLDPPAQAEPAPVVLEPAALERGLSWLADRGWNRNRPLVALHPGASSEAKRWPWARFVHLGRLLAEGGNTMLVLEGPAERGLAGRICGALPAGAAILAGNAPLEIVAAAISPCRLFIGNDSGVAHLAAALNVPSIVLFGPTLPQLWAPLGGHVLALRRAGGCPACASGRGSHNCLENLEPADLVRNSELLQTLIPHGPKGPN